MSLIPCINVDYLINTLKCQFLYSHKEKYTVDDYGSKKGYHLGKFDEMSSSQQKVNSQPRNTSF